MHNRPKSPPPLSSVPPPPLPDQVSTEDALRLDNLTLKSQMLRMQLGQVESEMLALMTELCARYRLEMGRGDSIDVPTRAIRRGVKTGG